jgi:hypothetical protein
VALMRVAVAVLAAASALLLAAPGSAAADTVVPAGRTVVEITAVGEDVILNGASSGTVIVIDGNLTLGPRGVAGHGVTVIGGELTTTPGATIHGDILQLGGPIPNPSGWTLAGFACALLVARLVVVWLIVRLAGLLATWPTTRTMLAASRRRPLRSTLVGALLAVGVLAAGTLLALTLVGLLFAAALGGVLLLASALGVAFALQGVHEQRHRATIALSLALPIVGDALLAVATLVALGAAFHYLVDERAGAASPTPTEP